MRDNVFDVPIGLLRELVAMPVDMYAGNGRLVFTGVCLSAVAHRLVLEGDGLVGRCLVVSSYATFGCDRFGSVCSVGPDWFADLSSALDFVDWHEAADANWVHNHDGFSGHEYEVWHVVADPVEVTAPAVDAVPGSSRAARGGSVSVALTGEHDGVFDVALDQFETWADQAARLSDSDALTWWPERHEWVYRSRGVWLRTGLEDVRVGDWFRVFTSAVFGSPALDVYAVRIPDDAVGPVLSTRETSYCNELFGLGYEVEYWHIVDYLPRWHPHYDPRLDQDSELFDYDLFLDENGYWDPPAPEHMARIYASIEKMRSSVDDHYWDERPEPQPADTWYEIDLFGPEVV